MPPRPAAEVEVTHDLVRRLLREQHPDLADLPLGPRVEGWDCVSVPLGTAPMGTPHDPGLPGPRAALAVRVPRRAASAAAIPYEQRWLPVLAPHLPLPVPAPVRVGAPSSTFPWPWSVVPWFAGAPAVSTPPAERTAWAQALAGFLAALHRPAPRHAPRSAQRGTPLAARAEPVRARVASLGGPATALLAVWEAAVAAPPWAGAPVWVHGDLHAANLVVDDGDLAAVVDFIDLTAGDPATDLATAWLTFDAAGRAAFRALVDDRCSHDAATWARARGWAVALASSVAGDPDPQMAALAAHTLDQVLLD